MMGGDTEQRPVLSALELEIDTDLSDERVEKLLCVEDEPHAAADSSDDTSLIERRGDPGRRYTKSHSKSKFYQWLNSGVEFVERGAIGAGTFIGIFVTSLALILFMISIRVNQVKVSQDEIRETEQLLGEVIVLRQEYSRSPLVDVLEDLSSADTRIFTDYTSLANWLSAIHLSATSLGLNFQYTFGEVTEMTVQRTVEVPITVSVSALPDDTDETFSRSLQMFRELVDSRWFVEVIGIVISGNREEASALNAELRVWVHNDATAI